MNFDIYFPLFENILHGDLNPLLSTSHIWAQPL